MSPDQYNSIVVLTGAGISAESGLKTFRGKDGLWEGERPEEIATPQAYAQNPEKVLRFYNERRRLLLEGGIKPNPAHVALAEFEKNFTGNFTLVTQNVDNLHEQAGSKNIVHMHGELTKVRCTEKGDVYECLEDITLDSPHPNHPEIVGTLRPHIVWFGEVPFDLDIILEKLATCDLFISIGTSGLVYPAAGFVQAVPETCYKVQINLDYTPNLPHFDLVIDGKAGEKVPQFFLNRLPHESI